MLFKEIKSSFYSLASFLLMQFMQKLYSTFICPHLKDRKDYLRERGGVSIIIMTRSLSPLGLL